MPLTDSFGSLATVPSISLEASGAVGDTMDLDNDYEVIDKRELEEADAQPAMEDVTKPTQKVLKVESSKGAAEVVLVEEEELWKGYLAFLFSNLVAPSLALYQAATPLVKYLSIQAVAAGSAVVSSGAAVHIGHTLQQASTVASCKARTAASAVSTFYSGAYSHALDQAQVIDRRWFPSSADDATRAATPNQRNHAGKGSKATISSWKEGNEKMMVLMHAWLLIAYRSVIFEALVFGLYMRELACRLAQRAKLIKAG